MKKLLLLFPVFLFGSCIITTTPEPSVKADKGIFFVQGIEPVENDSSKILSKYKICSDTLVYKSYIQNEQQGYNPFKFFLTDTSGKYKIGDTLKLILKNNTNE